MKHSLPDEYDRFKSGQHVAMNALETQLRALVVEIRRMQTGRSAPLVVALDGRSGAGKSTLASKLAAILGATVVPTDDFFAASIPDAGWDARSAEERAADAIEWRRIRTQVLVPLIARATARWHAFDFCAGLRPDGTYPLQSVATERQPSDVVILEGAYCARPELCDLIDLSVLVEAPAEIRRQRLSAREDSEFLKSWHARWDGAEDHYFGSVRPPSAFDFIIVNEPG